MHTLLPLAMDQLHEQHSELQQFEALYGLLVTASGKYSLLQ